ncbi:glycosyl transferase [Clostridium botulinum]|nr:glycosyl transferase [Clostridium botulinum]
MSKIKFIIKKIFKFAVIFIFNIMKLMPLNKNLIILDSWKGEKLRGSLTSIYEQLILKNKLEVVVIGERNKLSNKNVKICKSKSIKHMYYLAVAKFWIVDTIYYDYFKPRKDTKYILVWHAPGAFKSFGISTVNNAEQLKKVYINNGKNLSHLIISSEEIKSIYSKELCINEEKILSLGLPRTDKFVKTDYSIKEKIYAKYNMSTNTKLILYAPTFRGEGISEFKLNFDLNEINQNLSQSYKIIVKLHPNNYLYKFDSDKKIIISKDDNLEELMKASDLMITDYSSIIFEYCLLEKPILFYAYDLKNYLYDGRGFYINYKDFVPGPISYNTRQLVKNINSYDFDIYREKIKTLSDKYQIHDGRCTDRFIEYFFLQ